MVPHLSKSGSEFIEEACSITFCIYEKGQKGIYLWKMVFFKLGVFAVLTMDHSYFALTNIVVRIWRFVYEKIKNNGGSKIKKRTLLQKLVVFQLCTGAEKVTLVDDRQEYLDVSTD